MFVHLKSLTQMMLLISLQTICLTSFADDDITIIPEGSILSFKADLVIPPGKQYFPLLTFYKRTQSKCYDKYSMNETTFYCSVYIKSPSQMQLAVSGNMKLTLGKVKYESSKLVFKHPSEHWYEYNNNEPTIYEIPVVKASLENKPLKSISKILCMERGMYLGYYNNPDSGLCSSSYSPSELAHSHVVIFLKEWMETIQGNGMTFSYPTKSID